MAQLTAVEWMVKGLIECNYISKDSKIMNEFIKKTKAMEKEQIKNAYWNGTTDMEKEDALLMGEDYFNEYYKK
jgi:hypothetical protein